MNSKSISLIVILVIAFSCCVAGQDNTKPPLVKENFNLDKAKEDKVGYVQAVKVGNTIYVSGSVGSGNMVDALNMAYGKIDKSLRHYNLGFKHVVKETIYTTALDSVIKYKDVRKNYYINDYPAASWVEVRRLSNPNKIVEIEVTAILPEDK
jgi:2-iminobutanoate/2-iminopropanoate deaminase